MLNRIVDAISFVIAWALLVAVVAGLAIGVYIYHRADDEIRNYVETTFAQHYAPLQVDLRSARVLARRGIELRGFTIRHPDGQSPPLVDVENITIVCDPTIDDLLAGDLHVRNIIVSHPNIHAQCDAQGIWDVESLLTLPDFCGDSQPAIKVVNGTAKIRDARQQSEYTLRDIAVTVQEELQAHAVAEQGANRSPPAPLPWTQPEQKPRRIRVAASFTGDHLQHTSVDGVIQPGDPATGRQPTWRFQGEVPRVEISPRLRSALPLEVAQLLRHAAMLRSGGSFRFAVSHDPSQFPALQYNVAGELSNGRIDDPRLNSPITDIQASLRVTHAGFSADSITGRYGEARLELSCEQNANTSGGLFSVLGSVERLRVDPNMAAALPPAAQQTWQKFQPNGVLDAKFQMLFDGSRWYAKDVNVLCRDIAMLPQAFPYPLDHTTGRIHWHGDHVSFELRAKASSQPVLLVGEIDSPGKNWTGWMTGRTDGRIALDETLINALRPSVQTVVSKFGASGRLSALTEFRRESSSRPVEKQLTVNISETYLRHETFPYPLQNVSGRMIMVNDVWEFRDFQGHNDTARVTCNGSLVPHPNGKILRLDLTATELPLDDELRLALPPGTQALWNQVRPNGQLDALAASMVRVGDAEPEITITAEEKPNRIDSQRPTVSIHPLAFPYRIDRLTGIAQYKDGQLRFERLLGTHGRTKVHVASGSGVTSDDGGWQIQMKNLSMDRLDIDHSLLAALPACISRQLIQCEVQGHYSLQGSLAFTGGRGEPRDVRSAWDIAIDMDDASFSAGLEAEHATGTLRLTGENTMDDFYSQGDVEVDSMLLNGVHVTKMRGPIWADPNRILFGRWANPKDSPLPPTQLVARAAGGQVACDGQADLTDDGPYRVQLQLKDASTDELLQVFGQTTGKGTLSTSPASRVPKIGGRTSGILALSGNQHGRHMLNGTGDLRLTDAKLYELPVILSLFRTLRSGSVDRTAFTESNIQFRVRGDHITFDKLDLLGDSIALKGVGEMSGRQDLNLDFYTIIGKRNAYLNGIRPVLGIASNRFLQIHVTGAVSDPVMTREVLPGLNDTLRQMFPEVAATSTGIEMR